MQHIPNIYWLLYWLMVAAFFFFWVIAFYDPWTRSKKPPVPQPSAADIANCRALLRFLDNSFQGATIGALKMDDLAESLFVVIRAVELTKEQR